MEGKGRVKGNEVYFTKQSYVKVTTAKRRWVCKERRMKKISREQLW